MGILSHVHHLHLTLLVYHAVLCHGGHDKGRVHHAVKVVAAAHKVDKSLWVVEHTPCPMPGVAFGEGAAPVGWCERRLKLSLRVLAAHEVERWVKHVAVVHGPLSIDLYLLGWSS